MRMRVRKREGKKEVDKIEGEKNVGGHKERKTRPQQALGE